jgi:hypothetical protein
MFQAFLLKAVANESHIGVLGDYLLLKKLGRGVLV